MARRAEFSPIDDDTIRYLKGTTRPKLVAIVAAYAKAQGMFRVKTTPDPMFTDDAQAGVSGQASLAGPKRRTALP